MAREFVTKSSRFYCVSLKPDLCKTPMGNSTPPIPYTVKGEFADATGVSRNITSGGDPVVIDASTVIPSVTGDAPGSANGLKSGTVGKRVQHDGKSKTTSFNGERTIREGDTVWMNDKNTNGKIHERDGQAARPRIQPAGAPPPEKSFGDKFDDTMSAGADKINAGKDWAGGKINDFAQTGVGGKVMDGLKWVSEKTELTAVKQWKEGLAGNAMNAAEGIGGKGAGMAGSLTVAALEAIPTSLLDLVPGGGKAAGTAGKVASTASKLEHAAADAAKLGHKAEEVVGAAGKAEHATADVAKIKPETAGGGKDGGKSRRKPPGPCDHLRQGNGKGPYRGGAHSKTSKPVNDDKDSHHIPAKDASPLKPQDGPAIQMAPKDHAKTSSNGQMSGSIEYREMIADLIAEGKWREVMTTEIRDVRRVAREAGTPTKYNEAMLEMLEYFKCLEKHGLLK